MIKKLNLYGAPILNQKCKIVYPLPQSETGSLTDVLSSDEETEVEKKLWPDEVLELVQDLKDTAESLGDICLGLAAPQIWDKEGQCPSVFVVKAFLKDEESGKQIPFFQEMINPRVVTSGKKVKMTEGCLSVPDTTKVVTREANATVMFQTTLNINPQTMKFYGKENFLSFILQHEYDHLIGKLIKR